MMKRPETFFALVAALLALLTFQGLGPLVFIYPAVLGLGFRKQSLLRQCLGCALWGLGFSLLFYRWVGAYGLLPWLALSLARGLPWALYPVPTFLLKHFTKPAAPTLSQTERFGFTVKEAFGGGLGLGLVSWVLLCGFTGVDWETPAGALVSWPWLLTGLPYLGLVGFATLIGGIGHLLLGGRWLYRGLGVAILAVWVGLCANAPTSHPSPDRDLSALKVALLQTGFSQDEKWDVRRQVRGADFLLDQTQTAVEAGAELVIWPETAWPYRGMRKRYTNTRRIGKTARRLGADLLVSSIEETQSVGEDSSMDWSNSVSLVLANGKFEAEYVKRRLAPFAEYLPVPAMLEPALRKFRPFSQISRYVPGTHPTIFRTSGGHRFAALICYESMNSTMVEELSSQVDFFVVVTNDAPFDHEEANEAHFRSTILRALESQKPFLQAANTGVTGAVDARGEVLVRTPPGFFGPFLQYVSLFQKSEI